MANQQYKILLVEDDHVIRSIYETILSQEGFNLVVAVDGVEGLEAAEAQFPSLILLDLMMPNLDGVGMLKKLRQTDWGKGIPVVILTNIGPNEITADIKKLNVMDTLVKVDLSPSELIEKVQNYLNKLN